MKIFIDLDSVRVSIRPYRPRTRSRSHKRRRGRSRRRDCRDRSRSRRSRGRSCQRRRDRSRQSRRALAEMHKTKVPPDFRPPPRQIEHHRRLHEAGAVLFRTETVGGLRAFVNAPPSHLHIFTEHVTVTDKKIMIPFTSTSMWRRFEEFSDLQCFFMDHMFNTNRIGLKLRVCGPCGFHCDNDPYKHYVPTIFCLSHNADETAQTILMELLNSWRAQCPAPMASEWQCRMVDQITFKRKE